MSNRAGEYNVEQVFIELHKAHPVLSGLKVVHWKQDIDASAECIVVRAQRKRAMLEAFKGFEYEVVSTFRTTKTTSAREEAIIAAINDSVYRPASAPSSISKFSDFTITEEAESDRTRSKNLSKRSRSFPVLAKELA